MGELRYDRGGQGGHSPREPSPPRRREPRSTACGGRPPSAAHPRRGLWRRYVCTGCLTTVFPPSRSFSSRSLSRSGSTARNVPPALTNITRRSSDKSRDWVRRATIESGERDRFTYRNMVRRVPRGTWTAAPPPPPAQRPGHRPPSLPLCCSPYSLMSMRTYRAQRVPGEGRERPGRGGDWSASLSSLSPLGPAHSPCASRRRTAPAPGLWPARSSPHPWAL